MRISKRLENHFDCLEAGFSAKMATHSGRNRVQKNLRTCAVGRRSRGLGVGRERQRSDYQSGSD
jgi:hypothetical protein